ncbi:TetR/AcrR family transcriptional regulator [Nocardia sp. NPDC051030]|uniref:TetR/AcrR family transcriptional regulator n=1 Tax=Nocardia sp. NPDC051030 TaxID=3155162 RepID=UPI0034465062
MSEKASAATGTRERLLAAAERLLLTERYEDVSVRGICAAAGANAAAVHYHFGSKEALVSALIEDRLGPLWAGRLAVVSAERESVGAVVDAVIEPFLALADDPVGRLHLRLLAQLMHGRQPMIWNHRWFRMESWVALLPELSEAESRRRWMLAFDLIIMRFGAASATEHGMSAQSVDTLRDFVVAGLAAPVKEKK